MLILLVGLPGSGKTWYANNVLEYDYFIDDPKRLDEFPRDVNQSDRIVIAHPMLCASRKLAEPFLASMYPDHETQWIFFENNPQKCKKNVVYRMKQGDNRNLGNSIDHISSLYCIPSDVKTLSIWSQENEKNDSARI